MRRSFLGSNLNGRDMSAMLTTQPLALCDDCAG
jgi:hypothetical protein